MMNEKDQKKEQYTQVSIPDKEGMTILLKRAIGEMSNVEFADLCEISPVTIHRALHGKYTRPLPEHLLRTIADNSRDEEVTFDKLMLANGMTKKIITNELQVGAHSLRPSIAFMERRTKAWKTILNNLVRRNVVYRRVKRHQLMQLNEKISFTANFTVEILTDQESYYWNFELFMSESKIDKSILVEQFVRRAFDRSAKLFLANEWNLFDRRKEKFSIVFSNKEVFDQFNEVVAGLPIRGMFTTILLDLEHEKVIEEHQIGDCDDINVFMATEEVWEDDELEDFLY